MMMGGREGGEEEGSDRGRGGERGDVINVNKVEIARN